MSTSDIDENQLPSITLSPEDALHLTERQQKNIKKQEIKKVATAPLWALLVVVFIALVGVSWWSFQQIKLLSDQLVATQNSFAQITELADGRLQKISGLVSAAESSSSAENKAFKQSLSDMALDLQKQQEHKAQLESAIYQLQHDLKQSLADNQELQKNGLLLQSAHKDQIEQQKKQHEMLNELAQKYAELTNNNKQQQQEWNKTLASFEQRLKTLDGKLAASVGNKTLQEDMRNLKQDVLILRTELESKNTAAGVSQQEFDAFRAQINRRLGTK
ncbi:hypothetical protein VQ643_06970 [Pseudomonas sp. F1_0610]|uniref:hypothetical protein n=1 Tax=Pseudomonas sp. F1_0610 TaxID=3114284 RepID=UPI0039C404BA